MHRSFIHSSFPFVCSLFSLYFLRIPIHMRIECTLISFILFMNNVFVGTYCNTHSLKRALEPYQTHKRHKKLNVPDMQYYGIKKSIEEKFSYENKIKKITFLLKLKGNISYSRISFDQYYSNVLYFRSDIWITI